MTEGSCNCGCSTKPENQTPQADPCTCGCECCGEQEAKQEASA
jgi:hypothetical protein